MTKNEFQDLVIHIINLQNIYSGVCSSISLSCSTKITSLQKIRIRDHFLKLFDIEKDTFGWESNHYYIRANPVRLNAILLWEQYVLDTKEYLKF